MITKSSIISSKYQVTIPKRLADLYGLGPGEKIYFEDTGKSIQIRPCTKKAMSALSLVNKKYHSAVKKVSIEEMDDQLDEAITKEGI